MLYVHQAPLSGFNVSPVFCILGFFSSEVLIGFSFLQFHSYLSSLFAPFCYRLHFVYLTCFVPYLTLPFELKHKNYNTKPYFVRKGFQTKNVRANVIMGSFISVVCINLIIKLLKFNSSGVLLCLLRRMGVQSIEGLEAMLKLHNECYVISLSFLCVCNL